MTVDALGRPINVNDFVVATGSGSRYGVEFSRVEKVNKVRLTTTNGSAVAEKCIVITEQLKQNIRDGVLTAETKMNYRVESACRHKDDMQVSPDNMPALRMLYIDRIMMSDKEKAELWK